MTEREIEKRLKTAVEDSTPDVLDGILSELKPQSGKVKIMKNNRKVLRGVIGVAAAFVLVLGGIFAGRMIEHTNVGTDDIYLSDKVVSTVTFDVNPSIELGLSDQNTVINAYPLNDEAKDVLGDMDFSDISLDMAVNVVVGSMVRKGYISELSNSILISIDPVDEKTGEQLKTDLEKNVEELLSLGEYEGAVLSQIVKRNKNLSENAEKYGITLGKAQLIEKIISADNRYKFENLVGLTINELNLIYSDREASSDIKSYGKPNENGYIGHEKANEIALAHAGFSAGEVKGIYCEMDFDDGKMLYEVDFFANGMEYEYDISATDGSIVKFDKEASDDYTDKNEQNSDVISKEKAKEIVLNAVGLKESDIREYEIELDRENGRYEYEVGFKSGKYEYDYSVNAENGKILKSEKEIDD